MGDLEGLYGRGFWEMAPSDEKARKRFQRIVETFKKVHLPIKGKVRILDVAGGSGIASVAFCKALNLGSESELLVTDLRKDDLKLAHEWKSLADVECHVRVERLDALEIGKLDESFDVAILWGHSTPHFNPQQLLKVFSGVGRVLNADGTFLIEETDRIFGILYRTGYKEFLKEKEKIISVHDGYEKKSGCFVRSYYTVPGFERIATLRVKMWDTATVAAMAGIFFEDVEIMEIGRSDVIIASRPVRNVCEKYYLRAKEPVWKNEA